MKRYNFFLPEDLVAQLKRVAVSKDRPVSEVVRTALDAYLRAVKRQQEAKHGE